MPGAFFHCPKSMWSPPRSKLGDRSHKFELTNRVKKLNVLVLSSDLIDAMKYLFGYDGYLAILAILAMLAIRAIVAMILL